jgi:serine/threonine protein kinase
MSSSMHEDLMLDILDQKEQEELTEANAPNCSIKSFTVKYMIGEGSYGKVYLVQHRDTSKSMNQNYSNIFSILSF